MISVDTVLSIPWVFSSLTMCLYTTLFNSNVYSNTDGVAGRPRTDRINDRCTGIARTESSCFVFVVNQGRGEKDHVQRDRNKENEVEESAEEPRKWSVSWGMIMRNRSINVYKL